MAKRLAKQTLEQSLSDSLWTRIDNNTSGQSTVSQAQECFRVSTPYPARTQAHNRPTQPGQSRSISSDGWKLNNALSLSAEVAHTREAPPAIRCWACGETIMGTFGCGGCGAPFWDGRPSRAPENTPGVYVVSCEWDYPDEGEWDLWKIGMSSVSIAGRMRELGVEVIHASLPMPGMSQGDIGRIERWLHKTFERERAEAHARYYRLPAHTEWFWASPALEALVAGRPFMGLLDLPYLPDPEPWTPRFAA